MDKVRFGRALGYGARHAVKTLVTAVDAATAEDPSSRCAGPSASASPAAPTVQSPRAAPIAKVVRPAARAATRTVTQARDTQRGLRHGSRRFGEAVWNPFIRLSGVLGLEVSGVFFGIFALFGLAGAWRLHGDWHTQSAGHTQLLGALTMLLVFGYFCVSSFVRAHRRERRR